MKVVAAIKQVKVLGDEVELTVDGSDVDPDFLDLALNEWDVYAVEEALRIRERAGGEVVVVTLGSEAADAAMRRALAMGADRAVRVEGDEFDPLSIARSLAGVIQAERPDLVLFGVQSSDSVQGATGCATAGLLGLPCVAVVAHLDWEGEGTVIAHRELEGGVIDVVKVDLPAVLTVQTGINQPRYVNLRAIKQAEEAAIEVTPQGAEGPVGYRLRRMLLPSRGDGAEMLDPEPAAAARRILELVQEQLR